MSLFALADLHLALSTPKPMDIFQGWENYTERIRENWNEYVRPDDTVVINGDISWSMNIRDAYEDFRFIHELPGTKILSKGNHDYWWVTVKKITDFFAENGFDSIKILHNNCYAYGNTGICGTRGWINDDSEPFDQKIIAREAGRLETSIKAAIDQGLEPMVFLHYPPYFGQQRNDSIVEILHRYGIKKCFYGHLHGNAHKMAVTGMFDGIELHLVSGDYLKFIPYKIM